MEPIPVYYFTMVLLLALCPLCVHTNPPKLTSLQLPNYTLITCVPFDTLKHESKRVLRVQIGQSELRCTTFDCHRKNAVTDCRR